MLKPVEMYQPNRHQILQSHKILILLFCSVLVMHFFQLVPEGAIRSRYPYSDQVISLQSYTYFASMHVSKMLLYMAIIVAVPQLKIISIFFWLELVSTVDYFLRYNETLFVLYGHDITFGTIKLLILGFVIAKIIWKKL